MSEPYIPNAREAVIAYFGRDTRGNLRCYCVTCNDASPLASAHKVYGDLIADETHGNEACDGCGVELLKLSQLCQAEHDAQQAKWAKQPITALVEYGIAAFPRCRIY